MSTINLFKITAGEFHTSSQKPNVGHVKGLTGKWRKWDRFLGDINILSKLDADVRANEIFYHHKCQKRYEYGYNSSKKSNNSSEIKNNMF